MLRLCLRFAALGSAVLLLVPACSSIPAPSAAPQTVYATALNPAAKFAADRQAILNMAGEYKVDFKFKETVAFQPGYQLKPEYVSAATEFVTVLQDDGDFISMQHVLVLGERVVKHWRQDWQFEQANYYRYVGPIDGKQTWLPQQLTPAEVNGTWTQTVWQVDDSPRYQAHGRWQHSNNLVQWVSVESPRPLPRREWTHRSDYHVLVATNRHTLTPTGWVHEQDNYKKVQQLSDASQSDHVLARELGLNVYSRVTETNFTPGYNYWQATAPFWRDVRSWWQQRMQNRRAVQLQVKVGDEALYSKLFALAEQVQQGGLASSAEWQGKIDEILSLHASFPSVAAVAARSNAVASAD